MAYGKDPVLYADAISLGMLTPQRAKHCRYEYNYISDAFKRMIRPYVSQDLAKEVRASKWFQFDSPTAAATPQPAAIKEAEKTPAKK
jgi:hypothetical protein